jgi:hypothetical protein
VLAKKSEEVDSLRGKMGDIQLTLKMLAEPSPCPRSGFSARLRCRIVASDDCPLGSALMVFWRSGPNLYRTYTRNADVPTRYRAVLATLIEIETRVRAGRYAHGGVAYDPRTDPD